MTQSSKNEAPPTADPTGNLVARLAAAEAARDQALAALEEARNLQSQIMEAVPVGVGWVAPDGSLKFANNEGLRIIGHSRENVVGKSIHQLRSLTEREDGLPQAPGQTPVTKCLATGLAQPPAKIGVRRSDNSLVWTVYTAVPLRDPQGSELQGALVTMTDVTERLAAERQLRESEDRYRRLVENAPDAIIVHQDSELVYVNPAAVRLWGAHSAEQLLGRSVFEFIHPRSMQLVRNRIYHATVERGTTPLSEQTHVRVDGSPIEVETSGMPCVFQGRDAVQVIIRDISLRKQAEALLLQTNAELEQRVQARTHELLRKNDELEREVQERRRAEVELHEKQSFLERMLNLQERERQLISYEIHDTFVQDVIAAVMFYDSFQNKSQAEQTHDWEIFEKARSLLRRAIDDARRTISGLRPPIIDEQGIVAGIEFLANDMRQRGMQIELVTRGRIPRMPSQIESCVFRIVQEALNNVQRHSGVQQAEIQLIQEAATLHLTIRDPGQGFDPGKVPRDRFGLRGMKERARLLNARLTFETSPGRGTLVRLMTAIEPLEDG